jgi:hypothetical protein
LPTIQIYAQSFDQACGFIADAASHPVDELAQEVEQYENERPRFVVIDGSDNAA